MASLDSIRSKLHDLLIEKDGEVKPWDLDSINADAKELGLSEYSAFCNNSNHYPNPSDFFNKLETKIVES